MVEDGGPGRDVSSYSTWRESAAPEIVTLIDLYAQFLGGQIVYGSGALRVESAVAALGMMGFQEREIPDAIMRLNVIHSVVTESQKSKSNGR